MVKKTNDLRRRLDQLTTALRGLLIDNNGFIETGDEAYLLGLMSKLRSLVATGGPHLNPLLLDLSKELDIPLEIYAIPPTPATASKNHVTSLLFGTTWAVRPQAGMIKYTLAEWLLASTYLASETGEYKNRNEVIKNLANTEGGAHYSDKMPYVVDTLYQNVLKTGDRATNGVQAALIDMASAVWWLGNRLLILAEIKNLEESHFLSQEHCRTEIEKLMEILAEFDSSFVPKETGLQNIRIDVFTL